MWNRRGSFIAMTAKCAEPINAGRGTIALRHLRHFVTVPRSCVSPAQSNGSEPAWFGVAAK
jgi:hypothetical protein